MQRQQVPQEGGRDGRMAENSPSHSGCNPTANPDSSTKHPLETKRRKETFGVTKKLDV